MEQEEKITLLEEILEVDKGTLLGKMHLSEMEQWDSLAKISFISLIEDNLDRTVGQEEIRVCQTVNDKCSVKQGIRIDIEVDRRVFTPIDRASYKWEKTYDKRTSVERVNGRLDESFGFEKHYIRGKKKMKLRCGIALCVMLAMAVGRIKENQAEKMRSLVKST